MMHWAMLEWKQLRREPRYWVPLLLPQFLFLSSLLVQSKWGGIPFQWQLLGTLCGGLSISLNADRITGERERGALEILFLSAMKPLYFALYKTLVILFPVLFFYGVNVLVVAIFAKDLMSFYGLLQAFCFTMLLSGSHLIVATQMRTARSASQWGVLLLFAFMALALIELPLGYLFPLAFALLGSAIFNLKKAFSKPLLP